MKDVSKYEIHGYLTDFKSSCTSPISIFKNNRIQLLDETEIKNFKEEKFRHALFGLNLPKWKLITDIETSAKDEDEIKKEVKIKINNFIQTFRLVKPGGLEIRLIISFIDNKQEKFIDFTHLRTFAENMYEFNKDDPKNIHEIYNQISQIKNSRILNALERFNLSYHDFRFEDKIIDYIIALESLLSDGGGEIAFKLAYRSARLLELKEQPPTKVFNYIKKAYDWRSKFVHGSKSKLENKIEVNENKYDEKDFSKQLQEYTREILKILIEKPSLVESVTSSPFEKLTTK